MYQCSLMHEQVDTKVLDKLQMGISLRMTTRRVYMPSPVYMLGSKNKR